jgi:hypothetical protein
MQDNNAVWCSHEMTVCSTFPYRGTEFLSKVMSMSVVHRTWWRRRWLDCRVRTNFKFLPCEFGSWSFELGPLVVLLDFLTMIFFYCRGSCWIVWCFGMTYWNWKLVEGNVCANWAVARRKCREPRISWVKRVCLPRFKPVSPRFKRCVLTITGRFCEVLVVVMCESVF